ncbi:hypothetical protein ACS0TY_031971 [Phlomoides rotata]
MTRAATRFANDMFEQKRVMIWENRLIRPESTRRKACNMMHNGRWHEHKKEPTGKRVLTKEEDKFFRRPTRSEKFMLPPCFFVQMLPFFYLDLEIGTSQKTRKN